MTTTTTHTNAAAAAGDPPAHHQTPVTGIVLTNLGTPDAPTPAALKRYLAEFLGDPRVVEIPRLIWWPILHGIILNTRPRRSAHAYEKIWTDEGSPLLVIARRQARAIAEALTDSLPFPFQVELAMRYGNPSLATALERLRAAGAHRILIFPLYPQYSAATTATTLDAIASVLRGWRRIPDLRFISHYHDDDGYIQALTESIRRHQADHGRPDRLLFSFHGLPRRNLDAGDPYHCECHKTARLVASALGLMEQEWAVAFQSRFGPAEWLKPYTDELLTAWADQGIRHVQVICPGFSADCLETLEEIQLQYREVFIKAGGGEFSYIPALNDAPDHIAALAGLIRRHCSGWEAPDYDSGLIQDRVRHLTATEGS